MMTLLWQEKKCKILKTGLGNKNIYFNFLSNLDFNYSKFFSTSLKKVFLIPIKIATKMVDQIKIGIILSIIPQGNSIAITSS